MTNPAAATKNVRVGSWMWLIDWIASSKHIYTALIDNIYNWLRNFKQKIINIHPLGSDTLQLSPTVKILNLINKA